MTIKINDSVEKDPLLKRKRRRGAKARDSVELPSKTSRSTPEKSKPSVATMADSNLNVDGGIKDKKKKNKPEAKKKKSKVKAPKPGEEGFLTPTQLRNARKRRAKQQKNSNEEPSSQLPSNLPGAPNENISDRSRNETTKSSS